MAKRRKGKRKLTKEERRAIAIRNLNKGRRPKRRRARAAAAEAPRRRRRHARAAAAMPRRRRRARAAAAEAPRRRRRKTTRRFTRKQRSASLRNLGKARSARRRAKRAHRKHPVRAYSYHRRPKRVRVRAHRSYEESRRRPRRRRHARAAEAPRRRRRHHRRHSRASAGAASSRRRHSHRRERYTMENPLDGAELLISLFTGALGFGTMDLVDRYLATHALVAGTATTTGGTSTYTDTPPTSGDYNGLYNATAVLAPMNLTRWLAGTIGPAVPIIAAQMIKAPAGRAALQMFGFGALMRTAGKAITNLVASMTNTTAVGLRLYDAEARAGALQTAQGGDISSNNFPTTGLGAGNIRRMGAGSVADTTANAMKANRSSCRCQNCTTYPQRKCTSSQSPVSTSTPTQSVPPPPVPVPPPPPPAATQPPVYTQPPQMPPASTSSTSTTTSGGRILVSGGYRPPVAIQPPPLAPPATLTGTPRPRNTRDWGYRESADDVG